MCVCVCVCVHTHTHTHTHTHEHIQSCLLIIVDLSDAIRLRIKGVTYHQYEYGARLYRALKFNSKFSALTALLCQIWLLLHNIQFGLIRLVITSGPTKYNFRYAGML